MSNQIAERHRKGSKSFQNRSHANENGGSGTSVDKQKSDRIFKIEKTKNYNHEIHEEFRCTAALEKGNEQRERR